MGFDKVKIRQIKEIIGLVALIILVLNYSDQVISAAFMCLNIVRPFLIGGVIAFVLNLPMGAIEKAIHIHFAGRKLDEKRRPASIIGSILVVVLLLVILFATIIPQIGRTIVELGNKIPLFINDVIVRLDAYSVEYPQLDQYVEQLRTLNFNWADITENMVNFLKSGLTNFLSSTVTIAGGIVSGIVNFVISFIFAIYILGQKEKLENQARRILSAYTETKVTVYVEKVFATLYLNFTRFITGQCKEAVILGLMFVITMSILRIPYALLVGVLIAFTALIPIVGAFIGCFVGCFLILVDNPIKAIWFLVVFLILQQIEGNLIYPKVVGGSLGLPSIWVLASVSIGGSLFGVAGMLFFIPLVSTIYVLLRDSVNERNAKKLALRSASEEKMDGTE